MMVLFKLCEVNSLRLVIPITLLKILPEEELVQPHRNN